MYTHCVYTVVYRWTVSFLQPQLYSLICLVSVCVLCTTVFFGGIKIIKDGTAGRRHRLRTAEQMAKLTSVG